jgi:hypothetical protein
MQEYKILFKNGRCPLSKVESTLKNNYAFSTVTANFYEIFAYLTRQQHEIRRQEALLSV